MALSPNEKEIYVANYDGGDVSIIDVDTNRVVAPRVPVQSNPQAVAFAPDGNHAYIVNAGSKSVTVLDTHARTTTATVQVGSTPTSVSVLPDGRYAYITNYDSNTVSILDTASEN